MNTLSPLQDGKSSLAGEYLSLASPSTPLVSQRHYSANLSSYLSISRPINFPSSVATLERAFGKEDSDMTHREEKESSQDSGDKVAGSLPSSSSQWQALNEGDYNATLLAEG